MNVEEEEEGVAKINVKLGTVGGCAVRLSKHSEGKEGGGGSTGWFIHLYSRIMSLAVFHTDQHPLAAQLQRMKWRSRWRNGEGGRISFTLMFLRILISSSVDGQTNSCREGGGDLEDEGGTAGFLLVVT